MTTLNHVPQRESCGSWKPEQIRQISNPDAYKIPKHRYRHLYFADKEVTGHRSNLPIVNRATKIAAEEMRPEISRFVLS